MESLCFSRAFSASSSSAKSTKASPVARPSGRLTNRTPSLWTQERYQYFTVLQSMMSAKFLAVPWTRDLEDNSKNASKPICLLRFYWLEEKIAVSHYVDTPLMQTWHKILKTFEKSKFWTYWYWFWYWKLQFQNIDFDIDIEICISRILILVLILNFLGILILILVLILKKRGKYWKF